VKVISLSKIMILFFGILALTSIVSTDFAHADRGNFFEIPTFSKAIVLQSSTTSTNDSNSIHLNSINGIYQNGDTLHLSGSVDHVEPYYAVEIRIHDPYGDVIAVNQVMVSSDNTFQSSFVLGGSLMKTTGIYTIEIKYLNATFEKHFWFESDNNSRDFTDILLVNNYPYLLDNCEDITCDKFPRMWGPPNTTVTWFASSNVDSTLVIGEATGKEFSIIYDESSMSNTFSYTFENPGEFVYVVVTENKINNSRFYMAGFIYIDNNMDFASGTVAVSSSTSTLDPSSAIYVHGDAAKVQIPPGPSTPGCETTFECFLPSNLVIDKDTKVKWSNDDSAAHTVTAGNAKHGPSGFFDSSLFMAGTTYENIFDSTGSFEYFCMVHPWMVGTVTVLNPLFDSDDPPQEEEDSSKEKDDNEDFDNAQVDTSSESYVKGGIATVSVPQGTSVPGCETTFDCFLPSNLVIDKNTKVIWSNDDSAAHTVTSGSAAKGPSGFFDSSLFMAGTTFSHSFDTLGTFEYFCMVHPWMEGKVTVITSGSYHDESSTDGGNPAPTHDISSGDNQWDTRPSFGVSHEMLQGLVVENGFRFNTEQFTLTDNHHTNFEQQSILIGTVNSFSATVYADKKLKVQEFLFGIPNVGEAHLAELGVEVWYDTAGNVDEVKVIQKSDVIDVSTLVVSHAKTKCLSSDQESRCDTTTVSMTFLEPLKDKVMAIKAIDFKNRDQRTYLNDGFDITGESLNPMLSTMIPSTVKHEGPLKVTQSAKYSPYWMAEDGRTFEMNSFGSFKQINQEFERFQDSGEARTRMHSGFGGIIQYEQNRALEIFDSTKLISELPDSFGYYFEIQDRINDEMKQDILLQEKKAQKILDNMDRQNRDY